MNAPDRYTQELQARLTESLHGSHSDLEYLAKGGMSVLFKAHHSHLRQWRAIKVYSLQGPELGGSLELFVGEAQKIAQLKHPHIRQVHDLVDDRERGLLYMVMDFIDGEGLDRVFERGPLDLGQSMRVAVQVTEALREAHRASIIHRDIKGANILLDTAGDAYLTDFGIAKAETDESRTIPNMLAGTLMYMAPELFSGHKADARSDLFALGCVFYQMFTGTKPFERLDPRFAGEVGSESESQYRSPSTVVPAIPAIVDALITRMVSLKREGRPETCQDVLDVLSMVEVEDETTAPPPVGDDHTIRVQLAPQTDPEPGNEPEPENDPGEPKLVSLEIEPDTLVLKRGHPQPLKARGRYSDGSGRGLTSSVTWTSSDSEIAMAIGGGMIEGQASGATTIEAALGEHRASCRVTVETSSRRGLFLGAAALAVAAIGVVAGLTLFDRSPAPRLLTELSDVPRTAHVGDEVEYELRVTNKSTATARGITVRDTLQGAVGIVALSGGSDANFEVGRPWFACTFDSLGPSASETVIVTADLLSAGLVSVGASVGADGNWQRTAREDIRVEAAADIRVELQGVGRLTQGGEADYQIQVRNEGPSEARDIRLRDVLSDTGVVAPADPSEWGEGNARTLTVDVLPIGESRAFSGRVKAVGSGEAEHRVSVSSETHDPKSGDNEISGGWTVRDRATPPPASPATPVSTPAEPKKDEAMNVIVRIAIEGVPPTDPGIGAFIKVDDGEFESKRRFELTRKVGEEIRFKANLLGYRYERVGAPLKVTSGQSEYTVVFKATPEP